MTAPTEPPAPTVPPRARRRRGLWIAVAAVAVVAVVGGVVALVTLRSGEPVGTRHEVHNLLQVEQPDRLAAGTVQLPTGQLEVVVTRPLRGLPDYPALVADDAEVGRVDGFGRWLGVEWRLKPSGARGNPLHLVNRQPEQFEVVLVADGARHDLAAGATDDPDARRTRGVLDHKAVYVALPGDPGTLTLEVAYDGETQVLDLRSGQVRPGRAAPLYEPVGRLWAVSAPRCANDLVMRTPGFASSDGDDILVSCRITSSALAGPYAPGRGWAAPGRTFLTFSLTTGVGLAFARWPADDPGGAGLYFLRLQSSALTLDGRGPVATARYYQQSDAEVKKANLTGAFYTFDVPAGAPATGRLHQEYADLDGPARDAPAGAPRQARGTVDLTITLTPPA